MNAIVNAELPNVSLQLPEETASLIKASIAENTLKAYQRALQSLTTWLSGQTLSDALLANYITVLHDNTISASSINENQHLYGKIASPKKRDDGSSVVFVFLAQALPV